MIAVTVVPEEKRIAKLTFDGSVGIATATSRTSVKWKNEELLWSDFVKRLSSTVRTKETLADYLKLPKSEQDEIKDVGGFVGGSLKGGRRKADSVAWRQVVTLDADFVKGDLWSVIEMMFDHAGLIYSTHKHLEDKPRVRFVFPLSRAVTAEEYVAVSKRIAADIGIDMFDDTTYQPHRLMYWPSTSIDGDYVFEVQDAEWLNPDDVLARYKDWRDPLEWPESSRQKQLQKKMADKQGDPTAKRGMVGAFCRAYSIDEAIHTFLEGSYEPFGENRFTYVDGSTAGGLILYDDGKFAYSHHGTDPVSGLLVNSFDLVRLHKFADLDDTAREGTPVSRMPSTLAMNELARSDDLVKTLLIEERLTSAAEDFGDDESYDELMASDATDKSWMTKLTIDRQGGIEETRTNLLLILQNDPHIKNKFALNEFSQRALVKSKLPWREVKKNDYFNDFDEAGLRNYLENVYQISSPGKTQDALAQVFHQEKFHPIVEYLESLSWDGIERLDSLLIDTLGAEDSEFNRAITRKAFVAAVARVMRPGCKFDYMLTLVGAQGLGKSSILAKMGGEWFSDSLTTVTGKEAYEQLQGAWIVEMGELSAARKADVESIKHFLTKRIDRFRVAYGKHVNDFPRQCIFVGTTNDVEFLRDQTGNRRFWVMPVGKVAVKRAWNTLTKDEVNQLWAEAVHWFNENEPLYLSNELEEIAREIQLGHSETSTRLGQIEEYLEQLVPENWEDMTISERRSFLADDFGSTGTGTILRDRICALELWVELFDGNPKNFPALDRREINGIIRNLKGWGKYEGSLSGTLRFGKEYGVQRAYLRLDELDFLD